MVKVIAPAMSLEASGTLGNAIVFSRWKGRQYVRSRVVPHNPKTNYQTGIRAMLRFLSIDWKNFDPADQLTWEDLAAATNISTFNAYIKANVRAWRDSLYPTKTDPATRLVTPLDLTSITGIPGERTIQCTIIKPADNTRWGIQLSRRLASPCTGAYDNTIILFADDSADDLVYIDGPLAPGHYYYSANAFSNDGKQAAIPVLDEDIEVPAGP
jgi:hypothetical protein